MPCFFFFGPNTMFAYAVIIKFLSVPHLFSHNRKLRREKEKGCKTIYYHLHAGFASAGQRIFEHSDATRVPLPWKKADLDSTEI
jgi:hypothetical protein